MRPEMEQRRIAIDTAIKNNDYAAFTQANVISQAEFDQIVKMRQAKPVQ